MRDCIRYLLLVAAFAILGGCGGDVENTPVSATGGTLGFGD